jgi:hypothetical protein
MAACTSIDAGASGFLRHRFVRALSAGALVILLVAWIALSIAAVTMGWDQYAGRSAEYWAGVVGIALVTLLALPGVSVVSALVSVLHRRVTAFLLLLFIVIWLLFWTQTLAEVVIVAFGLEGLPPTMVDGGLEGTDPVFIPIGAAYAVASIALGLEVALQALWQLFAGARNFRAARGWRPPVWHILSTFRRSTGLPSFLAQFARGRFVLTLLFFAVSVINAVIVLVMLAPFFVERPGVITHEQIGALVIVGVLLLLNIFGVGRWISRFAEGRATKLYQRVREWDDRPPIVFLRAFTQDDDRVPAIALDPLVKFPAGVGNPRSLDEMLLEHGSPYGPVIAIGDPRDPTPPLGAARIFVHGDGNEWQGVVKDLAEAAKAVVMCPTTSAGVKWELNLVASHSIEPKTIYIANPELTHEQSAELFTALAPQHELTLQRGQTPIAAYIDPEDGWRVLTARRRSVQTYTVGLNYALQRLFGEEGVALKRKRKVRSTE